MFSILKPFQRCLVNTGKSQLRYQSSSSTVLKSTKIKKAANNAEGAATTDTTVESVEKESGAESKEKDEVKFFDSSNKQQATKPMKKMIKLRSSPLIGNNPANNQSNLNKTQIVNQIKTRKLKKLKDLPKVSMAEGLKPDAFLLERLYSGYKPLPVITARDDGALFVSKKNNPTSEFFDSEFEIVKEEQEGASKNQQEMELRQIDILTDIMKREKISFWRFSAAAVTFNSDFNCIPEDDLNKLEILTPPAKPESKYDLLNKKWVDLDVKNVQQEQRIEDVESEDKTDTRFRMSDYVKTTGPNKGRKRITNVTKFYQKLGEE